MRRHAPLALVAIAAIAMLAYGPIPQPANYHDFADRRTVLGIPNAFDVLSNLGFAIAGVWGLAALRGVRSPGYRLFVAALLLTAIGSSYYHWAPSNDRLFWDRVPIALAAAGLLAGAYAQTHRTRHEATIAAALSAFGIASVLWWSFTDRVGVGDLRPYLLIQLAPIVVVPLWQVEARSNARERILFGVAAGLYVVAKIAEMVDHAVFDASGGVVSGHTLKHLLAAAASAAIVRMARGSPT